MLIGLIWPLALAAILSAVLVLPLRPWLLARDLVDQPGQRRSHQCPTPRGGGLAMAAAMLCVLALVGTMQGQVLPLLSLTLALAALGWADDVWDISVRWRLLFQLLIGLAMLASTGPVNSVTILQLSLEWPWLWSVLALVGVIWLINLHNFMDGADGLAAMQGVWTGLALGALLYLGELQIPALLGFGLAGSCLGFLCWNRPPARLFMGDTGSVMLGGLIGFLALSGAASGEVSIWMSLMVCSVFVVDATATLLLRLRRGARWYTPHREHLYQRLIAGGRSHGQVLMLYALVNLLVVLPAVLLASRFPAWEMALAMMLIAALAAAWSLVQAASIKENLSQ